MFKVSRPMLVVMLNNWVTLTKATPFLSNTSTSLAQSRSAGAGRRLAHVPAGRFLRPKNTSRSGRGLSRPNCLRRQQIVDWTSERGVG